MRKPNFSYESRLWNRGYDLVIGVDEVGRGAFAGPVVSAACVLNQTLKGSDVLGEIINLGIDDSKRLTVKKRNELVEEIKKFFYFKVGEASVNEINRFGIKKSSERSMRRAIASLRLNISLKDQINSQKEIKMYLLIDAFHVRYITGVGITQQQAIINGDRRSISIAAASIIAKVYRDTMMEKYALRYNKYQWHKNKGYGTKEHREAIAKFGITKLHRRSYVEKWVNK